MRRSLLMLSLMVALVLSVGACTTPEPEGAEPEGQATTDVTVEATAAVTETETTDEATTPDGTDVMGFEPVDSPGGTLIVGQGQQPETLYLYGGSMLASSHVLNSIYDGPIEGLDYDFQAVILEQLPKLEVEGSGATLEMVDVQAGEQYLDNETQKVVTATETVSQLEQLTVQFKIREGVTWEDGTPVTADDSVFSAKLSCDPASTTSKVVCERTSHYEKIDDRTVEWQGIPGYTDQTYFTNFYTPLARHQVGSGGQPMEEMAVTDINTDETFNRKPYSYGPFKVKEWVTDDHLTLVKNEYYWRKDEGLPFLDEVVHRFVDDSNTLLAALISGEVDVATQDGLDITQFDALEQAKESGAIVPHYVSGTVWEHIDFNLNPTSDRPAFGACKEIRQAIIYGTDRALLVDQIQEGKTKVQNTFVPEDHWAYPTDGSMTTYEYDRAKAEQILEDFGFTDADGDGVREASKEITCTINDPDGNPIDKTIPAGTPLELTLNTTSGNAMREQTTLVFQQNMESIGIKVNLDYLAADVFFEKTAEGPLTGRKYDLAEFAWLTGVQPPVDLYMCELIPNESNSWAGQNSTGWCSPEYDRLAKQANTTLEREKAVPLYAQAQAIFTEELPLVPLFARVKVMGTSPRVINFKPNATVNSETWNIETWGLAPE